jgi:thioredoxin-related protein
MFRRAVLFILSLALFVPLSASAVEMGDDGLHKPDWLRETFKDLREDLAEARENNQRLMVLIEQRGCIYCKRMHEEVFPQPEIDAYIRENYFVVQINMFGDVEVTDFDGTTLSEKDMVARWGALFTPTMMFFPPEVPEGSTADDAAVAMMPGAFEAGTTLDLLTWVNEEGYLKDEAFQKYHARMIDQRRGG